MDVAALLGQGETLLSEYRSIFAELPDDCCLKQPASWPAKAAGASVPHWLGFLEEVLAGGPPVDSVGPRFSRDGYCIPDAIQDADICIQSVTEQATFFGNYTPPGDLDGQTIDLVATCSPKQLPQVLSIKPFALKLNEDLASYAEIKEQQRMRNDMTTLGSIGCLQRKHAEPDKFSKADAPQGQTSAGYATEVPCIAATARDKFILSDHMPIGFSVHVHEKVQEKGASDDTSTNLLSFSVMSMNMLAYEYISFSFWNSEPQDSTRELWRLASRLKAAADRKTKWLPRQYADMARNNISDEELSELEDTVMVRWERLNRKLFKWVGSVQKDAFRDQAKCNEFAEDHVRLGLLAKLLMSYEEHERPDLICLQEVGLNKLTPDDFNDGDGAFPAVAFNQKLSVAYPALKSLLEYYQVVNASPKLNIRRGASAQCSDTGILLAKKTVMELHTFLPLTHAACEPDGRLREIYTANAGKPIVGVQIRDQHSKPIMDLFGAHFEKGMTKELLPKLLVSRSVPAVVTGDFNAVLASSPLCPAVLIEH